MPSPQTTNGVAPIRPTRVTAKLDDALESPQSSNVLPQAEEFNIVTNNTQENNDPKEEVKMDVNNLDLGSIPGLNTMNTSGAGSITEKSGLMTGQPTGSVKETIGYGPRAKAIQSLGRTSAKLCGFVMKKDAGVIFGSQSTNVLDAAGAVIKIDVDGKKKNKTINKFGLIGKKPSGFAGIIAEIPTQLVGVTARQLNSEADLPDVNALDFSSVIITENYAQVINTLYALTGGVVLEHEAVAMPGKSAVDTVMTEYGNFNEELTRRAAQNKLSYFRITMKRVQLKEGGTKVSPVIRNACVRPLVTPNNYIALAKDKTVLISDIIANPANFSELRKGYDLLISKVANDPVKSVKFDSSELDQARVLFQETLSTASFANRVFLQPQSWYAPTKGALDLATVAIPDRVYGTTQKDNVDVPVVKKAQTLHVNKDYQATDFALGRLFAIDTIKLTLLAASRRGGKGSAKAQEQAENQFMLAQEYMTSPEALAIADKAYDLKVSILREAAKA